MASTIAKVKILTLVGTVPEINHDFGDGFAGVDVNDFKRYQELNPGDVLADIFTYQLM